MRRKTIFKAPQYSRFLAIPLSCIFEAAVIFEILRYRLKPGCEASFAKIMHNLSIPLHAEAGIFVVFHGAIEGDLLGYILVRRFPDPGTMENQLNQFYASPAWRDGPRQSIVDAIDQSERTLVGLKERPDESKPEYAYNIK